MQRTADRLVAYVGEDKAKITLTDSAVIAVQEEANGRLVGALADVWAVEKDVEPGESFVGLDLNSLLHMRGCVGTVSDMLDVLIECRPLDELDGEDDG